MKNLSLLLLLTAFVFAGFAQSSTSAFIKSTNDFMGNYVNEGMVNYAQIKKNFTEIEGLYRSVGAIDVSANNDIEKKAFYLNAYNIIVIYQVSKYYPLKSPMDQSGFFDRVKHKVAGDQLTLNELEIKKIVLKYKDPRIHFALACGAQSCPPLASFAYNPESLENQLDARTKKALNDPEFIVIDDDKGTVDISEIFKWYVKDFTSTGKTVMGFINQYRTNPVADNYVQGYYQYNWNLNEQ